MRTDPEAKRRRRLVALATALALAALALVWIARRMHFLAGGAPEAPVGAPAAEGPRRAPDVHAPEGVRVRVEVLNATSRTGLARRATMLLRDAGFDVVKSGTSSLQQDSTVVLDRTGHPEWAALVAKRLGGARVESRPDPSGYLDVTVLLGASYRPPAEPFYP